MRLQIKWCNFRVNITEGTYKETDKWRWMANEWGQLQYIWCTFSLSRDPKTLLPSAGLWKRAGVTVWRVTCIKTLLSFILISGHVILSAFVNLSISLSFVCWCISSLMRMNSKGTEANELGWPNNTTLLSKMQSVCFPLFNTESIQLTTLHSPGHRTECKLKGIQVCALDYCNFFKTTTI